MTRALVAAAIVVGLLVALFATTPLGVGGVLRETIAGAFGSPFRISNLLRDIVPLLFAGIAVYLALKAGLFNIGAEGQFLLGGLAGVVVGLAVGGPLGIVLGLLAGVVAGGLWALPAGLIRAYRNGHEVITTIMLNRAADLLVGYLVQNALRDPNNGDASTRVLDATSRLPLPKIAGVAVPIGLPIAILGIVALAWWLTRTVKGYELRATGENPTAARFAGIDPAAVRWRAMTASGAIAGLGGAVAAMSAAPFAVSNGFSGGVGFNALGVALLAGPSALGLLASGSLFGLLTRTGGVLSAQSVPKEVTEIVLGLVILGAAAFRYRKLEAAS